MVTIHVHVGAEPPVSSAARNFDAEVQSRRADAAERELAKVREKVENQRSELAKLHERLIAEATRRAMSPRHCLCCDQSQKALAYALDEGLGTSHHDLLRTAAFLRQAHGRTPEVPADFVFDIEESR